MTIDMKPNARQASPAYRPIPVFNRKKFKFAEENVEFAGFELTMDGFKPAEHIVNAIRDFPVPSSITDVRSWFSLVNQVAYTFSQSDLMEPFRCLLQKKQPFYWDKRLQERFEVSKAEIVKYMSYCHMTWTSLHV